MIFSIFGTYKKPRSRQWHFIIYAADIIAAYKVDRQYFISVYYCIFRLIIMLFDHFQKRKFVKNILISALFLRQIESVYVCYSWCELHHFFLPIIHSLNNLAVFQHKLCNCEDFFYKPFLMDDKNKYYLFEIIH